MGRDTVRVPRFISLTVTLKVVDKYLPVAVTVISTFCVIDPGLMTVILLSAEISIIPAGSMV